MKWFSIQRFSIDHLATLGNEEAGVFVLHKFSGVRKFLVSSHATFAESYLELDKVFATTMN